MNIISKTRHAYQINDREYRRDNKKWTIQRNRQHRVDRTKKTQQKHNTICVGHLCTQMDTNNVNKTRPLLQTTRSRDESDIVFMRKS